MFSEIRDELNSKIIKQSINNSLLSINSHSQPRMNCTENLSLLL